MKHILFDLNKCEFDLLNDETFVKDSLVEAAKASKCEIIKVEIHKFEPQGVTGYALLAESHMSIHTWPEKGIAKCDIFTCSDECLPEKAIEYLGEAFKATEVTSDAFDRLL